MAFGAVASRFLSVLVFALAFLCSATGLGIYSYFLATERTHDVSIPNKHKAIEGITGAGVLYTLIALVFTCFLGGFTLFAFIGIVLDLLFMGAFIAVAILTRDGASSCNNNPQKTPLGTGSPSSHIGVNGVRWTATLHTICRLETVVFAVSILGALFFLLAALVQFWLGKHHHKEKKFGPSPANGYTSGSGRRGFFSRRKRASTHSHHRDAEVGAIPAAAVATHHTNGRHSYNTATTDSYAGNKYEETQYAPPVGAPVAGGYHTGPAGAEVNPYGYDNTTRSHAV